jgi:flagellar basal-body rod modification protein FlgD
MTTVNSSTSSDILNSLSINKKSETEESSSTTGKAGQSLGQDAFMKLLVTQLKNQNPLSPQDNTQFVAQLAQFSSLEGIQNLNTTVNGLATGLQSSQALQASALVGRTVEVETDKAYLGTTGVVMGTMVLEDSTSALKLNVYNSSNELVWSKDLGTQDAGNLPFAWDGTLPNGQKLAAGNYRFEAVAAGKDKPTTLTTYLGNNVNSVTMGTNGAVSLNVNNVGAVALADVKNIL